MRGWVCFAVWAVAVFALLPSARCDIVLTLDISNPAATIFTATTAMSQSSVTAITVNPIELRDVGSALFLENVFTSANGTNTSTPFSGDLRPQQTANAYTSTFNLNGQGSIVLTGGGLFPQQFTIGTQALTGQSTANIRDLFGGNIPIVANLTGNIYFRNRQGVVRTDLVIGQYQIVSVPEPSSFLCVGLATCSLVFVRVRLSRKSESLSSDTSLSAAAQMSV